MNPQNIYHGILVNKSFLDPLFPNQFTVFAKKKSALTDETDWILYGIEVPKEDLEKTVEAIQKNMHSDQPWYAHLYNDEELIAIFKEKVFRVTPQSSTWEEIIAFGKFLNIPGEQLIFWPNRFQDEIHYFNPEDFIK
jgi:hypothetical protein